MKRDCHSAAGRSSPAITPRAASLRLHRGLGDTRARHCGCARRTSRVGAGKSPPSGGGIIQTGKKIGAWRWMRFRRRSPWNIEAPPPAYCFRVLYTI